MDARSAGRTNLRRIDELECVLSVLLAIALGHAAGASNVSWAAFSGYMVMRGHVLDSFSRAVLRVLGTGAGAVLALWVVPFATRSLLACALGGAVVAAGSLYWMLTRRHAYAALFFGLTFEMIMLDKMEHPRLDVVAFAGTRFLEVSAGTAACLLVSAASALSLRRRWPADRIPAADVQGWHPWALRHAFQGALAIAALPYLHAWFTLPGLAEASISIMAAMIVSVPMLERGSLVPVGRRLVQRAAGCLGGGAFAATVLLLAHGSPTVLLMGIGLGVVLGRHIENGGHAIAYSGTQFTLAVLVTLVPNGIREAAVDPAVDRLLGILIGIGTLGPILLAWHLASPSKPGAPD
jgi:uncharacterized membrane protein YccC